MSFKKIITAMIIMASLASCTDQGGPFTKEQVGTVLGGAAGAVAGAQFGRGSGKLAMTALGAVGGAVIGNSIGASLDKVDKMKMIQAQQQTLETARTGQVVQWVNPDTGNSGSFTPTNTVQGVNGEYCREYTQTVVIGGKQQQAYGKACRQPDGSWQIIQ